MAAKKRAGKPAQKGARVVGRPFVSGDPRANRTKPGPGRPTNEFKEFCKSLTDIGLETAIPILADKKHPAYASVLRTIIEHAHGKPRQPVDLEAGDTIQDLFKQAFGKGKPEKADDT